MDSSSPTSDPNASGGVNIEAQQVTVGHDVIGRDKVIQANTYIEHATIIQPGQVIQAGGEAAATHSPIYGGVEFLRIQAGPFLMGSLEDNALASDSEKPQHTVEIPYDYWLARNPVTNEQFARFTEATGCPIKLDANWSNKADHPVVNVTWHDALAYCNWLNTLARRSATHPAQALIVRLPTEAEWEKAARGGGGIEEAREWPWGAEFDRARCNSEEGGKKGTTSVGIYSPQGDSPFGLADVIGNVWEWTCSLWGMDLFRPQYGYPYQPQDGREKLDASNKVYRVVRGGAFNSRQSSARCAYRYWFNPPARSESVGFRVAIGPRLM